MVDTSLSAALAMIARPEPAGVDAEQIVASSSGRITTVRNYIDSLPEIR
jgi:hypothetical protein